MRLKILLRFVCVFIMAAGAVCAAQTSADWTGEWGEYRLVPAHGQTVRNYLGERLAISDCSGDQCKLEMNIATDTGHCDTSGEASLHIESAVSATASLGEGKCTLTLEKAGSVTAPTIRVTGSTVGCKDFCTPGAAFERTYPLRSKTGFFGDDIASCYLGTSKAQLAICGDQALAEQQHAWIMLSLELSDLGQKKFDSSSDPAKVVERCDSAADPAACLRSEFDHSTADLNQRKQAWMADVTEPGDPAKAGEKIAALTGRYRHSFMNGDVQGDSFKTVDRLLITKLSDDSIHYSLVLNFYNGHECSRNGTASYKKNGSFVDQVKGDSGEICFFEIVPSSSGIRLLDPTGICRMSDCGARGGYNGAGFSFTEKVKALPKK